MVSRAGSERGAGKRIRTGIALSTTELCAADIRLRGTSDRAWRAPLEPPPVDGGAWPSLSLALGELARTLGVTDGRLAISLVPPLADVRRLELPPANEEDSHRLLARNAARYFVNARGPQTVGMLVARKSRGAPVPTVAVAASARLVAAIRAAAAQSGWTIDVIAPAESAWAAAALSLWPTFARQSAWALVAHEDRTDLLEIDNGRLAAVRRFRAGASDATLIADSIGPTARLGVVGVPAVRRDLAAVLATLGVNAITPVGEWATVADRADLLAAHFAGSEAGPVLRGEDAVVMERDRSRRLAWMMTGAAAGLLVVAAGVEYWGVHHQLAQVRAEREALRPKLASTMVGRTTVEATYRHLTALNAVESASPQWSSVIATLSEAIPDEAHLTTIRAREDSLIIDGLAEHAARVFDALEQDRSLVDVKAPSPVRRELQDDGKALDHFTIAARVARPAAVPVTRPVSAPTPAPTRPDQ